MWGTPVAMRAEEQGLRFIPTHVGNSVRATSSSRHPSVHPHACGELPETTVWIGAATGSSPRMWGTPCDVPHRQRECRFIPTHVGNSNTPAAGYSSMPVHPHACGELALGFSFSVPVSGSSPRMWGTLLMWCFHCLSDRFIPTHVGNSLRGLPVPQRLPVHPHACGELVVCGTNPHADAGSSPRMWGTHRQHRNGKHRERFIPTHVGNSGRPCPCPSHISVHPHACGELTSRWI